DFVRRGASRRRSCRLTGTADAYGWRWHGDLGGHTCWPRSSRRRAQEAAHNLRTHAHRRRERAVRLRKRFAQQLATRSSRLPNDRLPALKTASRYGIPGSAVLDQIIRTVATTG